MRYGLFILLLLAAPAAAQDLPPDFVRLGAIDGSIRQDIRYAGARNFTGAPAPGYEAAECMLLRPAAEALAAAQKEFAARGLSLLVFDCYRPARAARAFLRWAEAPGGEAMKAEFFPRVAKRDLIRLGYVAARSDHSRGIAVDVALMPAEARVPRPESAPPPADCAAPPALRYPDGALDFGTGFDCFDARAHAGAPGLGAEAAANRKLLAETLHRHGFVGYAREWWHFRFAAGAAAAPVRDFVLRCPRGFFAEPGTRICRPIR